MHWRLSSSLLSSSVESHLLCSHLLCSHLQVFQMWYIVFLLLLSLPSPGGLLLLDYSLGMGLVFDATEEATSGAGNSLYGCWIGFQDIGGEGGFVWYDGSSVEYVDFAPGEPNDVGEGGEDAVEMDFRQRLTRFGEWNDASAAEDYHMFPLCETRVPRPTPGYPSNWGTSQRSQFRLRICIVR